MRIFKLSLFLFVLFCLFSCEESKTCCTIINNEINLSVQNQQGKNLLSSPALFTKNNIETYHVINGKAQVFSQPNLDAEKGFLLLKDGNGKEFVRVFPYYNKKEKTSLTLIKFSDTKTDTLECEFKFSGSSVLLQKVWYNGVLKSNQFAIVK